MEATIKEGAKTTTLREMATKYAQHHFPISEGKGEVIKHDVAYHSYCDGFNAALRILMNIRNLEDPCYRHGIDPNLD